MHATPTKMPSTPVIRMLDVTGKAGESPGKREDNGYLLEDAAGGLESCVDPALTDIALQVKYMHDDQLLSFLDLCDF